MMEIVWIKRSLWCPPNTKHCHTDTRHIIATNSYQPELSFMDQKQVPNNRRISFESMKTCSIVKVGGAK
jgi:hypothetical protein